MNLDSYEFDINSHKIICELNCLISIMMGSLTCHYDLIIVIVINQGITNNQGIRIIWGL